MTTNEERPIETHLEIMPPSALESMERASIDMQIATARRYPRTLSTVLKRVTELATLDEETAGSCFYRLNRQGKNIEGPTIRFAEIAVSSFGNIRYGSRVVANDGKTITGQGFCHDLENNVMNTTEVKRRITNKDGKTYTDDMQVVTGNAACAIAARNAVFKVIPFAVVKSIMSEAKRVAIGDVKTLSERRTRTLEKLANLGVNEKRACAAVGKTGVEEIGLDDLATLFGLFNSVKEEEQTVEEAFPEIKPPIKFGPAIPPNGNENEPTGSDSLPKRRGRPPKADFSLPKEEKPAPPLATPLQGLRNLMATSRIEEKDVMAELFGRQLCNQGDKLDELHETKVAWLIENWVDFAKDILGE